MLLLQVLIYHAVVVAVVQKQVFLGGNEHGLVDVLELDAHDYVALEELMDQWIIHRVALLQNSSAGRVMSDSYGKYGEGEEG